MMDALVKTLGNITGSAEAVGIHRCMHYEWLEKDPVYKAEFEQIGEKQLDFYEQALNRLVKDGHPTAIIFALKTKGKHRGWVERQELAHSGQIDQKINLDIVEVQKREDE